MLLLLVCKVFSLLLLVVALLIGVLGTVTNDLLNCEALHLLQVVFDPIAMVFLQQIFKGHKLINYALPSTVERPINGIVQAGIGRSTGVTAAFDELLVVVTLGVD